MVLVAPASTPKPEAFTPSEIEPSIDSARAMSAHSHGRAGHGSFAVVAKIVSSVAPTSFGLFMPPARYSKSPAPSSSLSGKQPPTKSTHDPSAQRTVFPKTISLTFRPPQMDGPYGIRRPERAVYLTNSPTNS